MSLPGTPIVAAMRVREIVTSPTVRKVSFPVLGGLYRLLGALGLVDLEPVASMCANPFLSLVGQERVAKGNVLFEHVDLARAFLLVAWHDWTAHRPAPG
jgi:hypothetical protein